MCLVEDMDTVDANVKNFKGESPLIMAAANDNVEVIDKLLSIKGINVDQADQKGNTALHLAAKNGNLKAVSMLADATVIIPLTDGARIEF